MTKHAWFNNDYEGKALRRVFVRCMKRFEKVINQDELDIDSIDKVTNILTRLAKIKAELAKPENEYLIRLGMVEEQLGIGKKTLGVFNVKT
ncbi:MAG TPA: hypothetical protein VLE21_04750 [Candidatus Nitrosocosmicus sp.]|nr:hypothetical protein [Candidatus Nitrosocosmicus sp.]